jgi:hypothetical protein
MAAEYRALISVPIDAPDDDEAWTRAAQYANTIRSGETITGHLELLTDAGLVVYEDPPFRELNLP